MPKNHKLARAAADAGWTMVCNVTAYKAEKAGKPFVLVVRAGMSQECSGAVPLPPTISQREYVAVFDAALLLLGTTTRPSISNVGREPPTITPVERDLQSIGDPSR